MRSTQEQNLTMDNQDSFSKLGNDDTEVSNDLGDLGDPFNESAGADLFEKLMGDSDLHKSSGSLNSNNSFTNNVGNNPMFDSGLNAQDLFESALAKSDNSLLDPKDMETDDNRGNGMKNHTWDISPLPTKALSGGNQHQHQAPTTTATATAKSIQLVPKYDRTIDGIRIYTNESSKWRERFRCSTTQYFFRRTGRWEQPRFLFHF